MIERARVAWNGCIGRVTSRSGRRVFLAPAACVGLAVVVTAAAFVPGAGSNALTVPSSPAAATVTVSKVGYWMLRSDGVVYGFGAARGYPGSMPNATSIAAKRDGSGYWVTSIRGVVRGYGSAPALGGAPALQAGELITTMSATPSGNGYWLFSNRGRAFAYGSARRYGDLGAVRLNGPIVASVATPTGRGYYMVGGDGGIFAFGDARYHGSTGSLRLVSPIVGMAPTLSNRGYWLVGADGGVFAFGDARYRGSMGNTHLSRPIVGIVAFGNGYLMVATDGGVFNFSTKPFLGSLATTRLPAAITAIATLNTTITTSTTTTTTTTTTAPAPTTSPSSSPTTTTTTVPKTTTTTVPKTTTSTTSTTLPSGSACTSPVYRTTQQFGTWDYATNVLVNNNVWGPLSGWSQTLSACSPSNWSVTANQPENAANPGAIKSYPDTEYNLSGKTIAQYTQMPSCFAETSPRVGEWDAGYDTWLNNFGAEVMIWNEWTTHTTIPPTSARRVTIDGVTYGEWKGGGSNEYIYAPLTQKSSGCIDVLHFFKDLVSVGILHNTDVPNAVEYGVEIASTNGSAQRFDVTNFTFSAS